MKLQLEKVQFPTKMLMEIFWTWFLSLISYVCVNLVNTTQHPPYNHLLKNQTTMVGVSNKKTVQFSCGRSQDRISKKALLLANIPTSNEYEFESAKVLPREKYHPEDNRTDASKFAWVSIQLWHVELDLHPDFVSKTLVLFTKVGHRPRWVVDVIGLVLMRLFSRQV